MRGHHAGANTSSQPRSSEDDNHLGFDSSLSGSLKMKMAFSRFPPLGLAQQLAPGRLQPIPSLLLLPLSHRRKRGDGRETKFGAPKALNQRKHLADSHRASRPTSPNERSDDSVVGSVGSSKQAHRAIIDPGKSQSTKRRSDHPFRFPREKPRLLNQRRGWRGRLCASSSSRGRERRPGGLRVWPLSDAAVSSWLKWEGSHQRSHREVLEKSLVPDAPVGVRRSSGPTSPEAVRPAPGSRRRELAYRLCA